MNIKTTKDIRDGKYFVKFLLDNFTDEEIFYIARYGPFKIELPEATFTGKVSSPYGTRLIVNVSELPSYEFHFNRYHDAVEFTEKVVNIIKQELDAFIKQVDLFVGDEVFEVKAGKEIKKISEGTKKALDKNSREYNEVIEKNREAFEKLSKL